MTGLTRNLMSTMRYLVTIVAAITSISIYSTLRLSFPAADLDSSWQFGLNHALANGAVFGRDVIFTMGPYVSTYSQQYHPAVDALILIPSLLYGAAFSSGLLIVSRQRWPLLAVLIPFLFFLSRDALLFGIPFLYLLLGYRISLKAPDPRRLEATVPVVAAMGLLQTAMALLTLTKGTFGAGAVVAIAIVSLMLMVRGRLLLVAGGLIVWITAIIVLWALVQPLAGLFGYINNILVIASGYTDSMSEQGPRRQVLLFLIATIIISALYLTKIRTSGIIQLLFALGGGVLVLFVFKHAFVRHDGHAWVASGGLALFGFILWAGTGGVRAAASFLICVSVWLAIWSAYWPPREFHVYAFQNLTALGEGIQMRLAGRDALNRRFLNSLAQIRAQQPLPQLSGTVDIYSFDQSTLLAHGFDWKNRPIFQSYSAYDPKLLKMNASNLVGPGAPDNIIFSVQPIDGHFPSLEDGLSWPSLLGLYDAAATVGTDRLLLKKRRAPPKVPVIGERLVGGSFSMGQDVPLPRNGQPVWAKIEIKKTLLGSLVGALFKLPPLTITSTYGVGESASLRLIPGMAEAGFVISPSVFDLRDFMVLRLADGATLARHRTPSSFSIKPAGNYPYLWRDVFSVELFQMNVPTDAKMSDIFFQPLTVDTTTLADESALPASTTCSIDVISGTKSGTRYKIEKALDIRGWAAVSMAAGLAPEATNVVLVGRDGSSYRLRALVTDRSDINAQFNRPSMGRVGFAAAAEFGAKTGVFAMFIELLHHGKRWTCGAPTMIEVAASP